MNAQEYSDYIHSLGVTYELLKDSFGKTFADDIYTTFNFDVKSDRVVEVYKNDPILYFSANYEFGRYYMLNEFSIMPLYLNEEVHEFNPDIIAFGSFFTQAAAVNIHTNEVALYDHEVEYRDMIYKCAENSYKLLDAFAIYLKYIADECYMGKAVIESAEYKRATYARLTELRSTLMQAAGGDEYQDFFTEFLMIDYINRED